MSEGAPPGPGGIHAYVSALSLLALGFVGLAVVSIVRAGIPDPTLLSIGALVFLALLLLQWRGVAFYWRGHRLSTQLDEVALFVALLVVPPAWPVLFIPATAFLTHLAKGRNWLKGAFNVAAYAVAGGAAVGAAAALMGTGLVPPLLAAAAGVVAYAVGANLLLAGVFAILERANPFHVFAERLAGATAASAILGTAGGVTVMALLGVHPLALAVLLPFGYILWRFGVLSAQSERELSVHRDLGAVTHDLVGCTSVDMAANRVLDACGRLLECARVTLVLDDGRNWTRDFGESPADYYVGQPLPARGGGELGELRIHPRRGLPAITDLERQVLRLIAGQAAAAIENTRTLAAFESARGKLDLYLTTAQDAVLLVNPDGRVEYVNAAGARLFGLPSGPPNAHATDFFHHPVLTRRLRVQGAMLLETEARDRSGSRTFIVEAHTAPVRDDGSLLAVVRDVTERKRLEEETGRQRDLITRQEKLSTLGTLVAGVAHEVNNPLTYMKSNLELTMLDAREVLENSEASADARTLAEAALESAESMLRGIQRIETITQSLKTVSRTSRRQGPENLNGVVRDVLAVLKAGKPRNVDLRSELDESLPTVLGNGGQLHQVVLNLVKNAIEAMGQREGWVRIRTAHADGQVLLEVSDNGPGIPPEVLPKLFEPFHTTKENGTGLGLSISREIVRAHGGDVTVRSDPGQGAAFTISLPASAATAAEPAAAR